MDPSSPFRAKPKHWADIQEWVEANSNASTDHCLWSRFGWPITGYADDVAWVAQAAVRRARYLQMEG